MNHFGKGRWMSTIQMTFRIISPPPPRSSDGDGMFCALSLMRIQALTEHPNHAPDS